MVFHIHKKNYKDKIIKMELIDYKKRDNDYLFNLKSTNNNIFSLVLNRVRNTQFTIANYDYYFGNHGSQKVSVPTLTKIIGTETFIEVLDIINNQ